MAEGPFPAMMTSSFVGADAGSNKKKGPNNDGSRQAVVGGSQKWHDDDDSYLTVIDAGIVLTPSMLEDERDGCDALEERLRSLQEKTATTVQRSPQPRSPPPRLPLSGVKTPLTGVRGKLLLASAAKRAASHRTVTRLFGTPGSPAPAGSVDTTPGTPLSAADGGLVLTEGDIEELLALIEGLEARNTVLDGLLLQRDADFTALKGKFDELCALQRALDAAYEEEEDEEEKAGGPLPPDTPTTPRRRQQQQQQHAAWAVALTDKLARRDADVAALESRLAAAAREHALALAAERDAMLSFHRAEVAAAEARGQAAAAALHASNAALAAQGAARDVEVSSLTTALADARAGQVAADESHARAHTALHSRCVAADAQLARSEDLLAATQRDVGLWRAALLREVVGTVPSNTPSPTQRLTLPDRAP